MARVDFDVARQMAGLELNTMALAEIIPVGEIGGARVGATETTIYDPNGDPVFFRVPLFRGRGQAGYTDLAANDNLGEPLLATTVGPVWDEAAIKKTAKNQARMIRPDFEYSRIRFVAFSYPKVGVQFLSKGKEVLMLELGSWKPIPKIKKKFDREPMKPANFERWSILDEMPDRVSKKRRKSFAERAEIWREVAGSRKLRGVDTLRVRPDVFTIGAVRENSPDAVELRFWNRESAHSPCFELCGQATNVWCVAASMQMLLGFYRYEYAQNYIAKEAGLGTPARPKGLCYSRVNDVVTLIESLSCGHLKAEMVSNPKLGDFRREIDANRPLISFVPGHSRTVAGYYSAAVDFGDGIPFRGLLVYDPWPPTSGAVHRYENFDAQTYQFAYRARLNCP